MSFDSRETSVSEGQPIRLYDFARGFLPYRYTSADRDIVYLGATYKAVAISDQGSQETGVPEQETFQIQAPPSIDIAQIFAISPPSQPVTLRVLDLHEGDTDARLYWIGQVSKVGQPNTDGFVMIACESIIAAMQVNGLRLAWQRGCPHTVYDSECQADKASLRCLGTLTAVTETTITAGGFSAFADTYFPGGFVEFSVEGGLLERRMIQAQSGGQLTLLGSTFPLASGASVSAFPGCSNEPVICNSLHANLPNYGGCPGLPGTSPFDSSPFI